MDLFVYKYLFLDQYKEGKTFFCQHMLAIAGQTAGPNFQMEPMGTPGVAVG